MQLRSQCRTGRKMSNHVSLCQLPEEVMTYMLKGLHIKDLLNMSSVSIAGVFLLNQNNDHLIH